MRMNNPDLITLKAIEFVVSIRRIVSTAQDTSTTRMYPIGASSTNKWNETDSSSTNKIKLIPS